MKKILALILIINTTQSFAGLYDGDIKVPLMGCGAFGLLEYRYNTDPMNLGLMCGLGALGAHLLHSYAQDEIGKNYKNREAKYKELLKRFQAVKANEARYGIGDGVITTTKEVVPASKMKDGSVRGPTIKYDIKLIDGGVDLGD